jgi:hypothetical protein
MPGANVVITISENVERSLKTEQTTDEGFAEAMEAEAFAEAMAAEKLADMRSKVDKDDIKLTKHPKLPPYRVPWLDPLERTVFFTSTAIDCSGPSAR